MGRTAAFFQAFTRVIKIPLVLSPEMVLIAGQVEIFKSVMYFP